jgi:catechol 2,3-dioxygenase-like lactoylglutathione lyase family enzyme
VDLVKSAIVALLVSAAMSLVGQERPFRFHHLHLAEGVDFYSRLFEPAITHRESVAGFDALRSGTMLLLFDTPASSPRSPEQPSAIWHFGWGDVNIGETYLGHAAREVEWEPPLPAGKLHVHLQSASPAQTAAWYRDVLGAVIDVLPGTAEGRPVASRPELRLGEAAVRFGDFAMVIHRTNETLVSTRGQRADHIAFSCTGLERLISELHDKGVGVLDQISAFGDARHAMIEGPDRIAIELVESR